MTDTPESPDAPETTAPEAPVEPVQPIIPPGAEPHPGTGMLPPFLQPAPSNLHIGGDKIDEIVSYLVGSRSPQAFDTRIPFTIVPEKLKLLDVEKHMPIPSRIRKNITFTEVDSFLDYFKLFKDTYKPRLFSRIDGNGIKFMCVFDYDGPGEVHGVTEDGKIRISPPHPQWNTHVAHLNLSYHRDYKTLLDHADKWHDQEDFALFIEENTHLFVQPDSATMLELAQDLKGTRNVGWKAGKRLSNGRVSLEWIEEIEAKSVRGDVVVPESLKLISPIFEGFSPQDINAAFRYRLDGDGGITFSYRLLTKLAERQAEDEVRDRIVKEAGLPIWSVSTFDGIIAK